MIKIKNLYKTFFFKKKSISVLENINLEIKPKKIFGLVGNTGSGKTTLLNIMIGILEPDNNNQTIIQKKFDKYQSSMIFQNFNLLNNINVLDNILLPLKIRKTIKKDTMKKVLEIINFVGLKKFIYLYPKHLSGGQKQRVAIARSLVYEPKIIFCDEPTSSLNQESTQKVLELFYLINKKFKTTIVLVSHDVSVIKTLCSEVAILEKKKIEKIIFLKPSYNFKTISYKEIFDNIF
jgi:D-methionine transport system ATP-binding protein